MKKLHRVILCAGAAGWASIAATQGAFAQAAPVDDSGEIVVTAQKRAQSVQDVGISLTAIGADELRRNQMTDVNQLANQIPNVLATTSSNLPAFTVRGIGLNEFASNFDSPVAVHIDEVYKSKPYMLSMPFYDIQRVEALKGPQGTLFGRNTTGGSVNYYTQEPQFTPSGGFNASVDNYGRVRADGFFNQPLSDTVAARASYYVAQGWGGPYRNLLTGKDFGKPNQLAGRLQLKWAGEGTTARLMVYGFKDKSQLTPYKSPGLFNPDGSYCAAVFTGAIQKDRGACLKFGPFGPGPDPRGLRETQSIRNMNADAPWKADNSAFGGYLRLEQEAGAFQLTSITAFDYFERDQVDDGDNTPYVAVNQNLYSRIKQFSQELRATAKFDRLNVLIGGFFEHDSIDEATNANTSENPLTGLPPFAPRLADDYKQKVRSLAIFTNNEYAVTDQLSLIVGLRYTNDRTSLDGSTYLGANDPSGRRHLITPVIPVDALVAHRTDGTTSFRGGVNWKASRDQLFYASISRGFRSGGYSVPFGGVITTFDPERLTAYEIGSKSRLLDRTLDLNLAAFFYDYKDIQTNVDDPLSPLVPITRNIGGSRTYGAEAELTWRPDPSWTVRLGGSYLDARFRNTTAVITTYAGPVPLDGKRPVNTPKWTAQGLIQKSVPLSDDLDLIGSTDFKYTAKRYLEATNQLFDRAPAYWVQNARLAVASKSGGWEIAAWGKNIFNKDYLTYLNNISFFRIEIYGEPVSYGLSASIKF
ncbi:TonB-dependent receptor [Rhizorhabdus wittichii]|uniref:TonB-dependent receptor n=1 Tax=Rhizorhabdus wittichii TaxID=160791 RepID=UPI0003195D26|nr:TonB-dependent receptor [Rhizorhabdus wittichii]